MESAKNEGREMSAALLDLDDRIIDTQGRCYAKHSLLLSTLLNGESIAEIPFVPHSDAFQYHDKIGNGGDAKDLALDDEGIVCPPKSSFDWEIPKKYLKIDVEAVCAERLEGMGLLREEYVDRLSCELSKMEEKGMLDFCRCLLWVADVLRKNGVVWGLGRGSSCASLVFFLLGVNKVDPVKYGIPLDEFL